MKNSAIIPEARIEYKDKLITRTLLMIGGGKAPKPEWLSMTRFLCDGLWCIDHGADAAMDAGLVPELLIGDGDSSSDTAWKWAEDNRAEILRFNPEKDYTDTQLALDRAKGLDNNSFVILTGCFGGRLDHLYSTLFSFCHTDICGIMADSAELVVPLKAGDIITLEPLKKPFAISLLPISEKASGVTISGVHWPLNNATLTQAMPYAISNEIEGHSISVKVGDGCVALYICWQE